MKMFQKWHIQTPIINLQQFSFKSILKREKVPRFIFFGVFAWAIAIRDNSPKLDV
jgi:hypothetical protein